MERIAADSIANTCKRFNSTPGRLAFSAFTRHAQSPKSTGPMLQYWNMANSPISKNVGTQDLSGSMSLMSSSGLGTVSCASNLGPPRTMADVEALKSADMTSGSQRTANTIRGVVAICATALDVLSGVVLKQYGLVLAEPLVTSPIAVEGLVRGTSDQLRPLFERCIAH